MEIKVSWTASSDPLVANYELQRASAMIGPWSVIATIVDDITGPNYDSTEQKFFYNDKSGSAGSWYRIIPITEAGVRGTSSTPFQPLVDPNLVSIATARFVGVNGVPEKTTILVASTGTQLLTGQIIGENETLSVSTDDLGRLEVPLVKGARVVVAIEGTTLVREFTVPDAPTFDLLAAMAAAPDQFTIQKPPALLSRRSV